MRSRRVSSAAVSILLLVLHARRVSRWSDWARDCVCVCVRARCCVARGRDYGARGGDRLITWTTRLKPSLPFGSVRLNSFIAKLIRASYKALKVLLTQESTIKLFNGDWFYCVVWFGLKHWALNNVSLVRAKSLHTCLHFIRLIIYPCQGGSGSCERKMWDRNRAWIG